MKELKSNFDNRIKDHVTVPKTHDDKVDENTGYIRQVRRLVRMNLVELFLKPDLTLQSQILKEKLREEQLPIQVQEFFSIIFTKNQGRNLMRC
jgi:hypothetical protein